MEITTFKIENPDELNFILGQSHFIKTVEDIYEIMVTTVPMAKFALAFCEASDVCLVRYSGTENKARVLVEGEDADRVTAYAEEIADALERAVGA